MVRAAIYQYVCECVHLTALDEAIPCPYSLPYLCGKLTNCIWKSMMVSYNILHQLRRCSDVSSLHSTSLAQVTTGEKPRDQRSKGQEPLP